MTAVPRLHVELSIVARPSVQTAFRVRALGECLAMKRSSGWLKLACKCCLWDSWRAGHELYQSSLNLDGMYVGTTLDR